MSDPQIGHPFSGEGEVRALAREIDWSKTSLGAIEGWSPTLMTVVRSVLDSPFPINLWCGRDLTLIYNDAYRHVLGAKHPEALGRPGPEVWSEIWEQIESMFARIRAGGPPVYAEDSPFVIEREIDSEDQAVEGANAWFTFALSAVRDESGEVEAFLNVVAETTDRVVAERAREAARLRAEHAEMRLREVFEQAPAFMAVVRGEAHTFEYANNAYFQLVGHRDLIGKPVLEALPEIRGQGFEQLLDNVLATGEPFVGREMSVMLSRTEGAESEQRFVDFVYYPITEADGSRTGVVAHGSDVTDHVRARIEAQRARSAAEEASQAKSQFLATMSHEIRTPINAIMGYSDLLELEIAGPLTSQQKRQLERVRASSAHLLMLVDDVLDLAKVEAGRLRVSLERTDAVRTIAAAVDLVAPQSERSKVILENQCRDLEAVYYVGDPDRVRQILANLLSNAIKFSEAGSRVRVSCGRGRHPLASETEVQEDFTYVQVQDDGVGIPQGEIEKIFRPFTQLDAGHTRTRGGTGLGLTISRHLARLMGGDLIAASEPGEGSTFTLWLPESVEAAQSLEQTLMDEARVGQVGEIAPVGHTLLAHLPQIMGGFLRRLKRDERVPVAATTSDEEILDHTGSFLADMAQSLIILQTAKADAARLLQDGGEIQRLMTELHGRQRASLGWTPEALQREWAILRDEIEKVARGAISTDGQEDSRAMHLLDHLLERAERVSRTSLRHALEDE